MSIFFVIMIAAVLAAVETMIWCHRRGWVPAFYVVNLASFGLMLIAGFAFTASGMSAGIAASGG